MNLVEELINTTADVAELAQRISEEVEQMRQQARLPRGPLSDVSVRLRDARRELRAALTVLRAGAPR
ncbi:MAG: hypothetical protein QN141_13525 [Armatimonadota bacterium]|nr:hypothetical protein [Armatimonadota bacterium]MDR7559497.1 hypothetical protein [Armatimonadota bacterium]